MLCSKAGSGEIKSDLLCAWVLDNLSNNKEKIATTIDILQTAINLHDLKLQGLVSTLEVIRNHLYCSIECAAEPDKQLIKVALDAINKDKDQITYNWFTSYLSKTEHVWPQLCKEILSNYSSR